MRGTTPSSFSAAWEATAPTSWCGCTPTAPSTPTPKGQTEAGRAPRRHGSKFALPDPESWPEPASEHGCHTGDYGEVQVRAWSGLHPKTRRIAERYGCERAPVVRGTVILVEVAHLPARPASRRSCGFGGTERRTGPGPPVAGLRQEVRPGAHDPLPQADPRVDHTEGQAPRAGGPLDVAGARRLRPIGAGALVRGRTAVCHGNARSESGG